MKTIRTLLLLLLIGPAQADVLVLVHGWRADADSWWRGGVMPVLLQAGWHDAGVVASTPAGLVVPPFHAQARTVYRTQLPATAPLSIQAAHLYSQLQAIRQRHPDEALTLAGHSAGGLVARMALLPDNPHRVDALISIAAPNLGTGRAVQGLEITDSKPFFCPGPGIDFLKSVFGGRDYDYLRASRGALIDMAPGMQSNWLNQQPHPAIRYTSIIHLQAGYPGDELVPAESQDLNQVPALHGRSDVFRLPAGHGLTPADGQLLLRGLAEVK